MSKYRGFSASHWDEPEYTTQTLQNVAAYLICAADIVGVSGVNVKNTSRRLKVSGPKFTATLEHLELLGKLEISSKKTHIWWKSAMFYSLYKGNCSPKQLKSVETLLKRWDFTSTFNEGFGKRVVQHYANKYSLEIPFIPQTQRVSEPIKSQSQSLSQSHTQSKRQYPKIGSAYLKRFDSELPEKDFNTLVEKYTHWELLLFMIENITMNNEFRNPVGILITARDAPGSHLPEIQYHDYDAWKLLVKEIFNRNS